MSTFCLPVSGFEVIVHQPTGREDLLLQEASDLDMSLVFSLFDRLVRLPEDAVQNWSKLANIKLRKKTKFAT